MLSQNTQSIPKISLFNTNNNGINLDYLNIADNHLDDKVSGNKKETQIEDNFTINMKLNSKKILSHNYGIKKQSTIPIVNDLGNRKNILEISHIMMQKPISKV